MWHFDPDSLEIYKSIWGNIKRRVYFKRTFGWHDDGMRIFWGETYVGLCENYQCCKFWGLWQSWTGYPQILWRHRYPVHQQKYTVMFLPCWVLWNWDGCESVSVREPLRDDFKYYISYMHRYSASDGLSLWMEGLRRQGWGQGPGSLHQLPGWQDHRGHQQQAQEELPQDFMSETLRGGHRGWLLASK